MTNCDECKWSWNNSCKSIRANEGCYNCKNFNNDTLECRCTEGNLDEQQNCPYFEDYYGGMYE